LCSKPYRDEVLASATVATCSTDIIVAVAKTPEMFAVVLGHLASDELIKFSDQCSTGTKIPRVSWGDLARYAVVLPPAPGGGGLHGRHPAARAADDRRDPHESKALAATRDALLPGLLSGELRVGEIEKVVGRVA
jgi:type I restriction enzyme S subunit